jgi:hypothetical protein
LARWPSTLVVSHPPHGQVAAAEAAPDLGLAARDLALKVSYPIPEIWAAPEHEAEAQRIAAELRRAGARVALVPAAALEPACRGAVPCKRRRRSEAGVTLLVDGRRVEVSSGLPVTGLHYTPRAAGPGGRGDAAPGSPRARRVLRRPVLRAVCAQG